MSKEAMKLALEALKKLGDYPHAFDECTNAIKALEEALAKQEQGEPDDEVLGFNGWGFPIEHPPKPTPATKEQIREALVFNLPLYTTPQPKQEHDGSLINEGTKLKQEQGEPVAYFNPQVKGGFYWAKPTKITAPVTVSVEPMPLYTTPQQRKPLTDEQIDAISDKYLVDYRIPAGCALNFARDIEAKLKEKNT